MMKKKLRKKILVTGANGQLGRCLYDVSLRHVEYEFHFKTSSDLDITDKRKLDNLFVNEKYDYCINCAAYTAVDKAESDKENAYLVNAEAVKYIADVCEVNNTILIHISTDFVFDGEVKTLYEEQEKPNPINEYGSSKLKGEEYIQEISKNYFIIRTSWVYSEYGHNFVKTMLRLAKERDQISVVSDQMGSPTYAGDLAEVIIKIVNTESQDYGLYHYSNEGVASWYDFAKAIFDESNIDIKVKPIKSDAYPTPAKRPVFSIMDKSKIKLTLNIEIPYWRDSLKKVFTFI